MKVLFFNISSLVRSNSCRHICQKSHCLIDSKYFAYFVEWPRVKTTNTVYMCENSGVQMLHRTSRMEKRKDFSLKHKGQPLVTWLWVRVGENNKCAMCLYNFKPQGHCVWTQVSIINTSNSNLFMFVSVFDKTLEFNKLICFFFSKNFGGLTASFKQTFTLKRCHGHRNDQHNSFGEKFDRLPRNFKWCNFQSGKLKFCDGAREAPACLPVRHADGFLLQNQWRTV